jgi:hypothetical protein
VGKKDTDQNCDPEPSPRNIPPAFLFRHHRAYCTKSPRLVLLSRPAEDENSGNAHATFDIAFGSGRPGCRTRCRTASLRGVGFRIWVENHGRRSNRTDPVDVCQPGYRGGEHSIEAQAPHEITMPACTTI